MTTASTPFRLYTEREMQTLRQRFTSIIHAWWAAWNTFHDDIPQLTLSPLEPAQVTAYRWFSAHPDQPVISDTPDLYALLSTLCWGQEKSQSAQNASPMARAVLFAVLNRLLMRFTVTETPLTEHVSAQSGAALAPDYRATGALCATIKHHQRQLTLILPPALLASWLPKPSAAPALKPVSLSTLPLQAAITLHVRARPTTVRLKELMSIRPGDVLRLDHRRQLPFTLHIAHQPTALSTVELGHTTTHRAVKLAADLAHSSRKKDTP